MPKIKPRKIENIDWSIWNAVDHATLLFVVKHGEVLLIRTKRGLGAGKINGPGGRIEGAESRLEGALREVREEIGIDALNAEEVGSLRFQFVDGYSIDVAVFHASDFEGEPIETDEAIPYWFSFEKIPWSEMWEDDEIWLPLLLEKKPFDGRFIFEGDRMLDYHLRNGQREMRQSERS